MRQFLLVILGFAAVASSGAGAFSCAGGGAVAPPAPNPSNGAMPEFVLPDVNPASTTFNASISPRDYGGEISAWYFGHAT